jgi:hypothetical protein
LNACWVFNVEPFTLQTYYAVPYEGMTPVADEEVTAWGYKRMMEDDVMKAALTKKENMTYFRAEKGNKIIARDLADVPCVEIAGNYHGCFGKEEQFKEAAEELYKTLDKEITVNT